MLTESEVRANVDIIENVMRHVNMASVEHPDVTSVLDALAGVGIGLQCAVKDPVAIGLYNRIMQNIYNVLPEDVQRAVTEFSNQRRVKLADEPGDKIKAALMTVLEEAANANVPENDQTLTFLTGVLFDRTLDTYFSREKAFRRAATLIAKRLSGNQDALERIKKKLYAITGRQFTQPAAESDGQDETSEGTEQEEESAEQSDHPVDF